MRRVAVQREDFDPGTLLAELGALGGGGVASFIGHVRGEGGLTALTLEHHPTMTEPALAAIAEAAAARWHLLGVTIVHRVGALRSGEKIVFAAAAARHRAAALEACGYLIDRLKTDAPFWKQERFADGTRRWIEARSEDKARADAWR